MESNKKDVAVLTPEILKQTCTECHKYLSVGPVVITRGGQTICGRCKVDSLYDQIAEGCLFPCVNYNLGCEKLLSFNEAKDHEVNCSKDVTIGCPFCNYEGNEVRLVRHFKAEHSEDVVNDKFEVLGRPGYSRNLIFLKDKHILCLMLLLDSQFLKIYVLLSPSTSKFKRFTLSFFKSDSGIRFTTPHIETRSGFGDVPPCEEIKGNAPYVQLSNCFLFATNLLAAFLQAGPCCCRMDYVNDEIPDKPNNLEKLTSNIHSKHNLMMQVEKMDIAVLRQFIKTEFKEMQKCSKCKTYVTDRKVAFFCPAHHLACQKCTEGKCPECQAFVKWNGHSKFHDKSLTCECGCGYTFNIFGYLQHVHCCTYRRYKCPDRGCSFTGVMNDIKTHWHLNQLKHGEQLKLEWKDQAFYWLLPTQKELIYVTVEKVSDGQFLVTVYEEDAMFPSSYEFDICNNEEEEWLPLKNRIGRYVKIKSLDDPYLNLNVKKICPF